MNCNTGGKQVTALIRINLLIGLSLTLATAAIADTNSVNTTVLFQPPPEESQPEETEGAASRQDKVCSQDLMASQTKRDSLKLTAIVPKRNYGLTVAEYPTFWVYLPQTSARQAILSIKAEGTSPHWQQTIELAGESGTMGIKLSDVAPALETGKNYQWAVTLVCGSSPHPNDPVVVAWIRRVAEPNVVNYQLGTTSKLELAQMYARQGIWYDTLDILFAARKSSLANWQEIWHTYLQSGGLVKIADEPVVDAIR